MSPRTFVRDTCGSQLTNKDYILTFPGSQRTQSVGRDGRSRRNGTTPAVGVVDRLEDFRAVP